MKPEIDLELSIKALSAYQIEPAIIENMLSNLHEILDERDNKRIAEIIKTIKEMNPYPSDIFLEPSEEDWSGIGKYLLDHGKNADRIFAKWGRMVWGNCVSCMEDTIDE